MLLNNFIILILVAVCSSTIPRDKNSVKNLIEFLKNRALLTTSKPTVAVNEYRLPTDTIPLHYELTLATEIHLPDETDPSKFEFKGEVEILIQINRETNEIVLHSKDQTILEAQLNKETGELIAWIDEDQPTYDPKLEFLKFRTKDLLVPSENYKLWIEYKGTLRERSERGFYKSFYVKPNGLKTWFVGTQFQSVHARHAVPCYDEPGIRANFTLSVIHHQSLRALSNMPIESSKLVNYFSDERMVTKFLTTPPMQPYILEIIVSDFEFIEITGTDRVQQRVYGRTEALQAGLADVGLFAGVQILEEQQKYFNTKYPLPKLDTAVHPSAGAMEHWGLVTINERNYLHDEIVESIYNKMLKITLISHEFAHQFFGDLVAPKWWNSLWLNEGFARYYEFRTVKDTNPDLRSMDFYIFLSRQMSFLVDQIDGTHPINQEVGSPAEIDGIFDLISYDKAAGFIRMLEHVVGESIFKRGLSNYLEDMAYKSVDYMDLVRNLNKAREEEGIRHGVSLKDFVESWINVSGFPVVEVTLTSTGNALFTQRRFVEEKSTQNNQLQWIPLTFTVNSKSDFNQLEPIYWLIDNSIEIQNKDGLLSDPNEWIVVNLQANAYYRVNYDGVLWNRIGQVLNSDHERIHLYNRAQLIDDVLYLAQFGYTTFESMLNIWSYLSKERDFLPWSSANLGLFFLLPKLTDANCQPNFMRFLREIYNPIYMYLGPNDLGFAEGISDKYNRQLVLLLSCLVGDPNCVSDANQRTRDSLHDHKEIEADIRAMTYCNGLRYANSSDFDLGFDRMIKSNDSSLRGDLIYGLSCNFNQDDLRKYLNSTIDTKAFKYFDNERDSVLSFVITGSANGVKVAIDFISVNFRKVEEIYSKENPVKSQVALMSNYVTSDSLLLSYEELLTILVNVKLVTTNEKETFLKIGINNVELGRKIDGPLGEALVEYFKGSNGNGLEVQTKFILVATAILFLLY